LAVELLVPNPELQAHRLRYEIEIGITEEHELQVLRENLFLSPPTGKLKGQLRNDLEAALARHPKELFEALVRLVRLRRSPDLYFRIGERVSLQALKREAALSRIAKTISFWFPSVGAT
jgi:hypothetical protein